MTYTEFIDLVREMRAAQKAFFKGDRSQLEQAKKLEREVDRQLKKNPQQADLFD